MIPEHLRIRLDVLKLINTELSRLLKKKIRLTNFGQKHPMSYCFEIDGVLTNIVIGYEELMFMRTDDEIVDLAKNLSNRIKELEDDE